MLIFFYVDGIPIYNKSNIEFWPIMGRIQSKCNYPFIIGIYCGRGKPRPLDIFLSDFVSEAIQLLNTRIKVGNKTYPLNFSCFCCDAPARSFLKVTKGHTSISACERCTIKSNYAEKRRFYPVDEIFSRRTSLDFAQSSDVESTRSPLLKLNVNLVEDFGALRRLVLKYWIEGKRSSKLSKIQILAVDKHIKSSKNPLLDFGHSLRPLSEAKRWKATEFRFFVLYCGPVVLKNVLPQEKYRHFLLLHVAVTIMASKVLIEKYLNVAKEALNKFV